MIMLIPNSLLSYAGTNLYPKGYVRMLTLRLIRYASLRGYHLTLTPSANI